jgi:hypothetical protein
MRWHRLILPAFLLSAVACQTTPTGGRRVEVRAVAAPDWQATASTEDSDRLGRVAEAWERSLAAARAAGFGRRIAAEGALLNPAAALARPQPTPGAYMCRLVRIGAASPGRPAFAVLRPVFCFVGIGGSNRLSITKPEGSERPAGYLWDDEQPTRMIFLGSLAPGVGGPVAYGEDRSRDASGIFERIGDFRFRLVILSRDGPGRLDVFELVPAPRQGG